MSALTGEPEKGPPYILTLMIDGTSFAYLDGLRRAHFPPERNVVPAHITLFHQLPGNRLRDISAEIGAVCQHQRPLTLKSTGVMLLGRGVAFRIESAALQTVRRNLAKAFEPWLTAQDQQGFRPHVTVQNKVAPADARRLHAQLTAGFQGFEIAGEGLQLWAYLNGPWQPVRSWRFGG